MLRSSIDRSNRLGLSSDFAIALSPRLTSLSFSSCICYKPGSPLKLAINGFGDCLMITLHDKSEIESFLQKNVFLHLYSLGDLDDFFWNYTTWYGSKEKEEIKVIILLYMGLSLPILLALADDIEPMKELLQSIVHLLPPRFYAHLSPGLEEVLQAQFQLRPHGEHYKMALKHKSMLKDVDTSTVVRLSMDDLEDILKLYQVSYPGNWFDPRMLETNQYFGIKEENGLLSIAGVHVYSKQFNVAALGNIATHPDYRGHGLGKAVTARLCQSLSEDIDHIGLNVKTDNEGTIALYKKLGFEVVCSYGEFMVELR
jgi:RimJ/RimL family protein N-acetyltransferase